MGKFRRRKIRRKKELKAGKYPKPRWAWNGGRGGHTGIRSPDGQKCINSKRKVSSPHPGVNQKARQKKYSLKMEN